MGSEISTAQFLLNPHSGGGLGLGLLTELQALLPQAQVDDLLTSDMEQILRKSSAAGQKVIVCGGDGSVASVLDRVYDMRLNLALGIIPLGTGNDLARYVHCRGPANTQVADIITDLQASKVVNIDRMMVEGPGLQRSWYNYCSWGLDAAIAQYFDGFRKAQRHLCRSADINKLIYAILGLRMPGKAIGRRLKSALNYSDLTQSTIPGSTRSLLCANINSYAGGM
ncbi:MAG: hypothetical protein HRU15_02690, partial [Planctomycetes bacterium]|nr:hypothetical protein [Planctomycetota bacterium]